MSEWVLSSLFQVCWLRGGSFHLTPNEVSVHEQEYGLGSIIAQDELYEETSSEGEDSDSRYPLVVQQNSFLT